MAYTIMIKSDNTAVVTSKQVIMQREKLVNSLTVVTNQMYGDYDMSTFGLVLTYLTPLSKSIRVAELSLDSTSYDGVEGMLSYKLDVDTGITAENGDVKLQFMFTKVELDPDTGKNIQRVRMIEEMYIHVCQTNDWLAVPDEGLTTLAEIYLRNQEMLKSIQNIAAQIYQNNVADVKIDADHIRLKNSAGTSVGSGISLEDLNDVLVETGSQTSGNVNIINI